MAGGYSLSDCRPDIDYEAKADGRRLTRGEIEESIIYINWLQGLTDSKDSNLKKNSEREINDFYALLPDEDAHRIKKVVKSSPLEKKLAGAQR